MARARSLAALREAIGRLIHRVDSTRRGRSTQSYLSPAEHQAQ